jgi:hypothetical protein
MEDETRATAELRATADSIRHDAERVARLETVKVGMDVQDPRVGSVSREVEQLAGELADKAKAERELAEAAASPTRETRAN